MLFPTTPTPSRTRWLLPRFLARRRNPFLATRRRERLSSPLHPGPAPPWGTRRTVFRSLRGASLPEKSRGTEAGRISVWNLMDLSSPPAPKFSGGGGLLGHSPRLLVASLVPKLRPQHFSPLGALGAPLSPAFPGLPAPSVSLCNNSAGKFVLRRVPARSRAPVQVRRSAHTLPLLWAQGRAEHRSVPAGEPPVPARTRVRAGGTREAA